MNPSKRYGKKRWLVPLKVKTMNVGNFGRDEIIIGLLAEIRKKKMKD